jgi:hypothetical protein
MAATENEVANTPQEQVTRDSNDEPKFNEQTLQRSKLGRQPRDILPPSRTRLLEPADIWHDLKRR